MKHLLLILLALPAFARTLDWNEIAVRARLDQHGRLHVREQQTIVFDGDWNGGERVFRLEPGQVLDFHGMSRIDERGTLVPLTEGDVGNLHHYQLTDDVTLRWRSRMPEDPPFRNTSITYVLDYTLSNILIRRGNSYRLDHDFAFTDRDGIIRRFRLDFEVADVWSSTDIPRRAEAQSLGPGEGFVVRGNLRYTGAGNPETRRSTLLFRLLLAMLPVVVVLWLWRRMKRHEESIGRLVPLSAIPGRANGSTRNFYLFLRKSRERRGMKKHQ